MKTVALAGYKTTYPNGILDGVVERVIQCADIVRSNEGEEKGTLFAIVATGTDLGTIGYPLEDSHATNGYIKDNVCFLKGNIDKKLQDLLAYDGATIVDGESGDFYITNLNLLFH